MKTYIYIYILEQSTKNYLVINVDNAEDSKNLEALEAYKMPDEMVTSIFGENAKYADNTTCTVAENAENPVFPFTVSFDASKITPKNPLPVNFLGQVKLIDVRTTTGIWTITGLTPYKPLFIVSDNTKGTDNQPNSNTYTLLQTSVNSNATGGKGAQFVLGEVYNEYSSTDCFITIPQSTTVQITVHQMISGIKLSAYN